MPQHDNMNYCISSDIPCPPQKNIYYGSMSMLWFSSLEPIAKDLLNKSKPSLLLFVKVFSKQSLIWILHLWRPPPALQRKDLWGLHLLLLLSITRDGVTKGRLFFFLPDFPIFSPIFFCDRYWASQSHLTFPAIAKLYPSDIHSHRFAVYGPKK